MPWVLKSTTLPFAHQKNKICSKRVSKDINKRSTKTKMTQKRKKNHKNQHVNGRTQKCKQLKKSFSFSKLIAVYMKLQTGLLITKTKFIALDIEINNIAC